ncbi:MAG: hypothetical protein RLZZ235_490 [Pseudomonadota bacterium]|jgi:hypothetical protein
MSGIGRFDLHGKRAFSENLQLVDQGFYLNHQGFIG